MFPHYTVNFLFVPIFTARCYAVLLAMGLCHVSVCLSVSVCHKSEFY